MILQSLWKQQNFQLYETAGIYHHMFVSTMAPDGSCDTIFIKQANFYKAWNMSNTYQLSFYSKDYAS